MMKELADLRADVDRLKLLVDAIISRLAEADEPDPAFFSLEAMHARFKGRLKGGK